MGRAEDTERKGRDASWTPGFAEMSEGRGDRLDMKLGIPVADL